MPFVVLYIAVFIRSLTFMHSLTICCLALHLIIRSEIAVNNAAVFVIAF